MTNQPTSPERSDTAHHHWDKQWQTAEGRAGWLAPETDVIAFAKGCRRAGATKALDLGCGVGRHALALAQLGFDVAALDASPAGLIQLEKQALADGLSIDGKQAEMTALPFDDAVFDYVLSFNVIYHGDPDVVRQTLTEIARVLKPGGHYQGTMLSKRNHNFGQGREVATDTFVNDEMSDKAHPHFYCAAASLVALFHDFELLSLEDRVHSKPGSWHWHLTAERHG